MAGTLLALGCGGVDSKGESKIRFELTTEEAVSGLSQVRVTAGSNVAQTFALQSLSRTPTVFELPIPATLVGTVFDVSALARPASGCMGFEGRDVASIAAVGQTATVPLLMMPKDVCQTSDAGSDASGTGGATGTAGTFGTGGGGAGGSTAGGGGGGGSTGVGGSVGGGVGGAGGGGRGGTTGVAGTGGVAGGAGGRGGTTGVAGMGGVAGGAGGRGGATGVAGAGGQPSCSVAAGGRPAVVAPPSLTRCVEYAHNDPGAVCNQSTNANNPRIYDVTVSPDGQYLATTGSHQTSQPSSTSVDAANDRVRIWRLVGNTPSPCGGIDISKPSYGPAYVAFSPNGQYLAVGWRQDYIYVYSIPGFALVGSILSSYGPLYGIGWSPDSQTVFGVDYDDFLYDGTLYADRPNGTAITSRVLGVDPDVLAVSPIAGTGNVSTLAVGGFNGNVGVYTFNGTTFTAPTILTTGPYAAAWAAAFSPSGNLLAVGTDEGVVRFWNIPIGSASPSGNPINVTSGSTVTGLSFSPQGNHIAVGFDFEADIWNVTTRAFVSRASTVGLVESLAFSASGGVLITGQTTCGRLLVCGD
jgi:WD40 domain-containing protein